LSVKCASINKYQYEITHRIYPLVIHVKYAISV